MQTVRNAEGDLVHVPDAEDLEKVLAEARAERRWTRWLSGLLSAGGLLTLLSGGVYVARASDRAERTESALAEHLADANRRDENLTAILRMTDSLRIEMRHLTDAIRAGGVR